MQLLRHWQWDCLSFLPMVLSMMGMLVLAPAVGIWLTPAFEWFYNTLHIDPSIIPASLFANDMGGMTLAQSICKSEEHCQEAGETGTQWASSSKLCWFHQTEWTVF